MVELTTLDGGMGQELIARQGGATMLWSAQALVDDPDLVRQVHLDYFSAGADIATTNTYACLPSHMGAMGVGHQVEEFHHLACTLAVEARDTHGAGLVAGGLGPIAYSYRPDLAPPPDAAAETYAPLAAIQAEYVDLHLLETMASVDEARGALLGCQGTGLPVWLSVTVDERDGSRLRSGEPVAAVASLAEEFAPEAVLINCSPPEAVTQALRALPDFGCRTGAYANGFVTITDEYLTGQALADVLDTRQDLDPARYASHVQDWVDAGATIVGGCCEVGPAHIAEVHRCVRP